jgi:hypothetical protein
LMIILVAARERQDMFILPICTLTGLVRVHLLLGGSPRGTATPAICHTQNDPSHR